MMIELELALFACVAAAVAHGATLLNAKGRGAVALATVPAFRLSPADDILVPVSPRAVTGRNWSVL